MAGWRWMCTMARHGAPWRSHFSGTSRNSTWPVLACLISGKVIYTHTYMYLFLIYIYICNIYIYIYIHIPNVEFSWIFLWRGWITIWASQALTGGLPKWHTPFKNSDESTQSWLVGWFTQLPLDKPQPTYHTYHKGELSHDCDSWVFSNQELRCFFPLAEEFCS